MDFLKALTLSALVGLATSGSALAASDVDASLDEIAGQIMERTDVGHKPTIGISTFTHADGTCSQLSNYITEFIVDSLFNEAGEEVDIIERSQLSAIFREMQMVYDGTIAPDTAKRLGDIAGVDALVTGSLIEFGEEVKVQARLISTSNGRLFATARSSFPSIGSVTTMMNDRRRATCDFKTASGEPERILTAEAVQDPADDRHIYAAKEFRAEISSLSYDKDTGLTSFSIRVENIAESSIGLSLVPRSISISDEAGNMIDRPSEVQGIRACNVSPIRACIASNPQYATLLPNDDVVQMNFQTKARSNVDDMKISLTFEMVITPNVNDKQYRIHPISFFDIAPETL